MDYSYTATYISPKDMKKKLKNDNFKSNANKVVYTFFGFSALWFCYTMYKIILTLF